jgi:HD-GYP domain-containing protein (c-di-GMP phosphodiesterase class II)
MSDNEKEELPVVRAIQSATTQICRDIAGEAGFKIWRDAVLSHGYISNIALPLSGEGRVFGALSIYSSESEPFDDEEVQLLEELANDLAYGIGTLRTRAEHEQHAVLLQQSLEQSILTIAATVEARDPYTAGHQRRVGELATAIAQEMELPDMQVQGIHFAAIIHDLGKIHVPAEILSKPGRLNELEYRLIQTHSQAGYDILKDVSFPWPIAEIILQHHEKLDGSGYPQGLKDGEIRLEAKIIAVADVVEAISSHRPYRPALGVKPALEEIRQGRGRLYDPSVVDACLRLFNEKGFAFNSEF